MVEVFFGEYAAAVFQAVAVYGPALDRIVLDDTVGPLAELHRTLIVNLEADGDNHLQVVMIRVVAFPIGSSYSEFPNN